jgi:ribosomal protein S18 acetylase RimI-like enzyme
VAPDVGCLKRLEDRSFDYDRLCRRSIARAIRSPSQDVLILEGPGGEVLAAAILHSRKGSRACRLYSIAVAKPGCGLGTRLLEACEAGARKRGHVRMLLEVRADHQAATRFYRQRGYRDARRLTGYYEDGADALRLEKALGTSDPLTPI